MDPIVTNDKITSFCFGYIRINQIDHQLISIPGIILKILEYSQGRYDPKHYIELQSGGREASDVGYYLLPKDSVKLSGLLSNIIDTDTKSTIHIKQVPSSVLHAVCQYLGHHKNVKPLPIPCPVPSTNIIDFVPDKWNAHWIDKYSKKEIFEIILAANYMDIMSLLHLGCAKMATLIKGLSQQQINRMIEEEARYRRGDATNNNMANNNTTNNNNNNVTTALSLFGGNNSNINNFISKYGKLINLGIVIGIGAAVFVLSRDKNKRENGGKTFENF